MLEDEALLAGPVRRVRQLLRQDRLLLHRQRQRLLRTGAPADRVVTLRLKQLLAARGLGGEHAPVLLGGTLLRLRREQLAHHLVPLLRPLVLRLLEVALVGQRPP